MSPRTTKTTVKTSGLLSEFASTQKIETALLGKIQAHVVKKIAEPNDRRKDIIHPSELAKADVCPRAIVWRIRGVVEDFEKELHGVQLEAIFQEGHDIHNKYQTWLQDMGDLRGAWRCSRCGEYTADAVYRDLPDCGCNDFGSHSWAYGEVPINGESAYMIYGFEDGWVEDSLVEIKSIGLGTLRMEEPELVRKHTVKSPEGKSVVNYDGIWAALKRPLVSHRKQVGIYMRILRENGVHIKDAVLLYENKANQSVKEFVVDYEPALVDPLFDMALDIKWAVQRNKELPRPSDFEEGKGACKTCQWRLKCWGRDDGSEQERDTEHGAGIAQGEEDARPAEDLPSSPTGRVSAGTTRRPNRPLGQRTDAPVHVDDEVGGVPVESTGRSRGRREVRRSSRREGQGDSRG